MKPNWHYYEACIEIKPLDKKRLKELKVALDAIDFQIVDLVAIKRGDELNIITTSHAKNLQALNNRVGTAVRILQKLGYTVMRYKIESTVLDSKHEDKLGVLC